MITFRSYNVVIGNRILISTLYLDEARDYATKKIIQGKKVLIIEYTKIR